METSLTEADCRDAIKECTCFNVRMAGRLIGHVYDKHLRKAGLNSGQMATLFAIRNEQPLTIGALSEIMALERTAMGRALRPLEKAGLVNIRTDSSDHRKRTVTLTQAGLEKSESAIPYWRAAQREVRERIGDSDTLALMDCLHVAREKLQF